MSTEQLLMTITTLHHLFFGRVNSSVNGLDLRIFLRERYLHPNYHLRIHTMTSKKMVCSYYYLIKACGYSDPFEKNNHRSMTIRWPLTPLVLTLHVWLYQRIIVFKSHGNTSMYMHTVINIAKLKNQDATYYIWTDIHTTYRMSDHIVCFWIKFRWDKK